MPQLQRWGFSPDAVVAFVWSIDRGMHSHVSLQDLIGFGDLESEINEKSFTSLA